MLNQPADFARPVLAVSIHLHRHVVIVQGGIAIPRLHRTADPQVKRQRHHLGPRRHLSNRVIGRSIIDHQHIATSRQRLAQTMHQLADGIPFIKDRDNHQASHRTIRRQRESLHKQRA